MLLFWITNKQSHPYLKKIPIILTSLVFIFIIISPLIYLKIVPEYKYFNFDSNALNYITDKTMLKDFSGEVRKQQWKETWDMLNQNPKNFIFGTGLSNYQISVSPYHQEGIFFNKDRNINFREEIVLFNEEYKAKYWRPVEIYMYPHNLILNFWTELGLAGVLIFIWIIGKFIYQGIKIIQNSNNTNRYLSMGLVSAIIVIIVHGIVDVPYFKNDLAILFWVFIALLGILKINYENKK
jgi:O-antigen ligase